MSNAYLVLADGTVFNGKAIGATGTTVGETVFTTGMTGYLETLTDPSYYGQIVTQTFPLIGNYGVIPSDFESKKSWVRGYIVREMCDEPSNFRCGGTLDDFLKEHNIIGICGIDTRALTKKLRESGVMNGMIISGKDAENFLRDDFFCLKDDLKSNDILRKIRDYKIERAVESVSCKGNRKGDGFAGAQPKLAQNDASLAFCRPAPSLPTHKTPATHHVVLWDFGAKANIQRELEKRGCSVTVIPYDTTAEEVLALAPDGIMLSNGPGDPAENVGVIQEIKKLCEWNKNCAIPNASVAKTIPIFGICLGHQMLALARGAKTSKLKYGHRGGNHPVKDLGTGRVFITSQNHGYAVEPDTLPPFANMSFVNVNDNTCEGVEYTDIPAFSVQFHPEACGGPHDTNFLFDRFVENLPRS